MLPAAPRGCSARGSLNACDSPPCIRRTPQHTPPGTRCRYVSRMRRVSISRVLTSYFIVLMSPGVYRMRATSPQLTGCTVVPSHRAGFGGRRNRCRHEWNVCASEGGMYGLASRLGNVPLRGLRHRRCTAFTGLRVDRMRGVPSMHRTYDETSCIGMSALACTTSKPLYLHRQEVQNRGLVRPRAVSGCRPQLPPPEARPQSTHQGITATQTQLGARRHLHTLSARGVDEPLGRASRARVDEVCVA